MSIARNALALEASIGDLPGVGPARVKQFAKLNIVTIEDLILYTPRDYIDYSTVTPIAKLSPGKVTIKAHVLGRTRAWQKNRRHMTEAVFEDDSGQIKAIWFNQPYRARQLRDNQEYVISGELGFFGKSYNLSQPSVERVESQRLSAGVVVARYPQTKGLNSRTIRAIQKKALSLITDEFDTYPPEFISRHDLLNLKTALINLHFPDSADISTDAQDRLAFDEVFSLQLANKLSKQELAQKKATKVIFNNSVAKTYIDGLPFKLTDDQRIAAWEILKDINSTSAMNRLLEGDVGTGKTVVAAMAALMCAKDRSQTALLAPTTILAEQHFKTFETVLADHEVEIAILTRHTKTKSAKELIAKINSGQIDILVGTHAMLNKKINFKNLALAIIDEQHRFGVDDRTKLSSAKTRIPHVLTMTATPIPRSLALTLYGELDISIIKQMPVGRKAIKTEVLSSAAKVNAYKTVSQEIARGNQIYIVAPRIENIDGRVASLEDLSVEIPKLLPKNAKIGMIHGSMKADKKDDVMKDFYNGVVNVLLGTTVVEVGVDNPNATVMLVEGAERFGLAQLHQLRGRVGRSKKASKCFLVTSRGVEPTTRLNAMKYTHDGFKLSTLDLKIRGPGALYGTRQHGVLDLNIADINDAQLLRKAADAVDDFIKKGYDIANFPLLNRRVAAMRKATFLN